MKYFNENIESVVKNLEVNLESDLNDSEVKKRNLIPTRQL